MAVTDEKDGALATAAAAAAAGVAAYGLRKALSSGRGGSSSDSSSKLSRSRDDDSDVEEYDDEDDSSDRESGGLGGSFLAAVWDSASESIVPLAEKAAEAAGTWVAENAPDIVREQLVPRFIEAFNDAA